MSAAAQADLLPSAKLNGLASGISELELTADEKWTVFHALDLCHGFCPASFPEFTTVTGGRSPLSETA